MGKATGIQWTDATWNPMRGCSRVSEGCRNCYAERVASRFSGPGQPYEPFIKMRVKSVDRSLEVDDPKAVTYDQRRWNGVVRMVHEHLADPLRWKKPRRIFVNSMSDLFHEALTNEEIAAVFGVMAAAPRHTFQILTKRERMLVWFRWASAQRGQNARSVCSQAAAKLVDGARWDFAIGDGSWPLPNVWLGVSVENQAAADERIPLLLETPAAVRFLSCEPLLERVDLDPMRQHPGFTFETTLAETSGGWLGACRCDVEAMDGVGMHDGRCPATRPRIDWVIAGCESGPGARPAQVDWYRALRDQCAAAGVPFFLKQATHTPGDFVAVDSLGRKCSATLAVGFDEGSGRKAGGVIGLPYLDGVQHAAFPEAQ